MTHCKVAGESDFRNESCTCVMKTSQFFLRNKLSRLEHVLFLHVFFRKSRSTATFERKPSSVSSSLDCKFQTSEGRKVKRSVMAYYITMADSGEANEDSGGAPNTPTVIGR